MSIGATLQTARQAAGLSVEDVATTTRIRATLIRQIESDNFEPCGGAIYARGHVRNIAAAVGLDPAPVVAEFNATQAATTSVPAHQIFDRAEIVQRAPTGPNWTAAMFVTALLLAVVAFVTLLSGPDGNEPTTAQKTTASAVAPVETETQPIEVPSAPESEPVVDPAPSTPAEPTASEPVDPAPSTSAPVASSSPAVVAFTGVRLQIKVTGARCWVHVTDLSTGKRVVFQGVLERGAVKDFTATSKLRVTFGDAGAVVLNVNGRDLGPPGGRGKVVNAEFVPGDPGAG
ncbi:MAG: RodZ domain-containing protein [Mycobacteriales bacterium]